MDPLMLVTGASSGIGAAVTSELATHAQVIAADLHPPQQDHPTADTVEPRRLDVTDEGDWAELATDLQERPEPLAAIVHNAGTAIIRSVPDTTRQDFLHVLETNLLSVFLGTRALWDRIIRDGTSVVCVASVSALVGQDAASSYVASKGGLVAMVRELAVELAPHGARVNAVSPGSTSTPLLERHFAALDDGGAARDRLIARQPLGRLMQPSDIAPVIAFLCGPGSKGMNGANVVVDGGLTATFDYGSSFAGGGR
jgi:NAD(P)-dependent dehydrogenase (short-subunit alcohol dehydrogenase family)